MNMFFFGAMQEYIEASYAPTGRAKCKTCKDTIEKDSLRLGIIINDDHFGGKSYYHPSCFSLKPRFKELDPETQIYQLDQLEQEDAQQILTIMKNEIKRLKEGKKASKRPPAKEKAKAKGKSKKKQDSDSDYEEEEEQVKKPKGRTTRSRSKSMKDDKSEARSKKSASKSESKQAKQPKRKAKKKATSAGYTEAQKKQFNEYVKEFMMKSADDLKLLLAANVQSRTGNKIELAEKCADGKLLGKIPMCSSCGGGKLRFNRNNGLYTCPGYMDDDEFRNCNKTFTMSEVVRDPWTEA